MTSKLAIVAAGEPTLFDSLARLVPEELQAAYYRVLAHTRTLSPDDEMLRILEAMGTWPCSPAKHRRKLPRSASDSRRCSNFISSFQTRHNRRCSAMSTSWSRGISDLPSEIEAGLDPRTDCEVAG